ncbi:MAG: TolC family protein [Polyangiales bacterium]
MKNANLHSVLSTAEVGALALLLGGCIAKSTEDGYERVLHQSAQLSPPTRLDAQERAREDDAELAGQPRLATVLRLALLRNPELREARERVRASAARVMAKGRLPDPELKYEQWAVPLDRPYALDKAGMLMLGVRQSFPAPGSLDAESRAALQEAEMTLEAQRARVRDLRAAVARAYFDYARACAESEIRHEHERLATRVLELARGQYLGGGGRQQDVLRLEVELSRAHGELIELAAEQRSARAQLNTLMARNADAPLGTPPAPASAELQRSSAQLEAAMLAQRPELASGAHAIERSKAMLRAAHKTASLPSFMVGLDYWLMPQASNPHAYGAMVSMSLPWLNPQHDEEVREAEHMLAAERSALEAARNGARYELHDALARYQAARDSLAIVDLALLGQTQRSYEAAESAFATGQGDAASVLDALRMYLDVRIEQNRARARLQAALAEVERSASTELVEITSDGRTP